MFRDGYDIRKTGDIYQLTRYGKVIAEGDSRTAVTREYITLTAKRSKVDQELARINFPIEVE